MLSAPDGYTLLSAGNLLVLNGVLKHSDLGRIRELLNREFAAAMHAADVRTKLAPAACTPVHD